MATEQDTSSSEATLRPQTPAARARNPEADRERTPEERDRLREESRARRKARAEGRVGAPEPPADEIKLRRATEEEREAPAQLAPPPAKPAHPAKPEPSSAKPPAPAASPRPAPAPPAAGRVSSLPWLQPLRPDATAEAEEAPPAEA